MFAISRRVFVFGAPLAAAGCVTQSPPVIESAVPGIDPGFVRMYAEIPSERFPVPAIDLVKIDPQFFRREIAYDTPEEPGTIVVDPGNHFLFLVRPEGRAIRYGVGVGRDGFDWNGRATIRRKSEWPVWTPPAEMIKRQPELEKYRKGMPPGLDNPLGARALYLYQGDRDTLYRIHGTNDPSSIGLSLSSGCIRLLNQDIIDLHSRVPLGTKVVVLQADMPADLAAL
nr:L,D-transpeptidase [Pseudochelatococcus lubricantis]